MESWLIGDYEKRCFNLLAKLNRTDISKPYKIEAEIKENVKRIMKEQKCDKLSALKRYKAELFNEFIAQKK